MKIIGIGIDICGIERMARILSKPSSQNFKDRFFTPSEIEYCEKFANPAKNYAARWAVKEAFYKALPDELQKFSSWQSVEFCNLENKKPFIVVCEPQLLSKMRDFGISKIHCSVSHEKEFCVAQVLLES
jgi:holo-[acyl-carrier protein] synthase